MLIAMTIKAKSSGTLQGDLSFHSRKGLGNACPPQEGHPETLLVPAVAQG